MDLELLKEAYDALTKERQAFYVERDGKYHLDAAVLAKELQSQSGLKINHDKLLSEVKTLNARLKEKEEAETAIKEASERKELEAQKAAGDFEGIKKSYEAKLEAAKQAGVAEIAQLKFYIDKLVVESDVFNIAKELAVSGAEPLLMDRIRPRVRAKYTDDGVVPEYLNEHGQPTVFNRAEFKKQIELDPSCKLILKGSDATGGGHLGAAATGGALGAASGSKKFNDMTSGELIRLNKESPHEYERLLAEHKAAPHKKP